MVAVFVGWWVGGWTWYADEAAAEEAASGYFGDGYVPCSRNPCHSLTSRDAAKGVRVAAGG